MTISRQVTCFRLLNRRVIGTGTPSVRRDAAQFAIVLWAAVCRERLILGSACIG